MLKNLLKYRAYFTYMGSIALIVLVLHTAFLHIALNMDLGYSIIDSFVFNLIFVIIALTIYFPAKYITFTGNNFYKVFFSHFAASLFASSVWYALGFIIIVDIFELSGYRTFLNEALPWRILTGLLYYFIVASVNYGFIYYKSFQDKLTKEVELYSYAKEAELKSLKYQINPHFIFNSLNSIASLTTFEPELAREMTVKLSTYLRSTLATGEKLMSTLNEELKNARLYIEIEKVRFGDKISLSETIEPSCGNIQVPSLILQPLLENAVKYGVYESLDKVYIKLVCEKKNQYLRVSVENNFDADSQPPRGEKIGLNNIKSRLNLVYNQDNLLTVENNNNVFRVNLFIPLGE
ncbi:MAG: sensor histidine kinase [Bacteroidota bacterium]